MKKKKCENCKRNAKEKLADLVFFLGLEEKPKKSNKKCSKKRCF